MIMKNRHRLTIYSHNGIKNVSLTESISYDSCEDKIMNEQKINGCFTIFICNNETGQIEIINKVLNV